MFLYFHKDCFQCCGSNLVKSKSRIAKTYISVHWSKMPIATSSYKVLVCCTCISLILSLLSLIQVSGLFSELSSLSLVP